MGFLSGKVQSTQTLMDSSIISIVHCLFCNVAQDRVLAENETAIALHDYFPVAEGHTLVVPRRHVTSIYEIEGVIDCPFFLLNIELLT